MTDPADSHTPDYVLNIVIPVHNEEHGLPGCVRRLHDYVCAHVPYSTRITLADNASTDDTLAVLVSLMNCPTSTSTIAMA
jgi:glycosyltransferase involved in cell wall biosynthesis